MQHIRAQHYILDLFFNHRAKRGGSLFEGGSGEEEGSRSDPPPRGGEAPSPGREATFTWVWGHPPFVSFRRKSCPKRQQILMKLGRNDLQHKPDGWIRPFFGSAARGLSYGAQKAEKWAFWPFLRDFKSVRAPNRC